MPHPLVYGRSCTLSRDPHLEVCAPAQLKVRLPHKTDWPQGSGYTIHPHDFAVAGQAVQPWTDLLLQAAVVSNAALHGGIEVSRCRSLKSKSGLWCEHS